MKTNQKMCNKFSTKIPCLCPLDWRCFADLFWVLFLLISLTIFDRLLFRELFFCHALICHILALAIVVLFFSTSFIGTNNWYARVHRSRDTRVYTTWDKFFFFSSSLHRTVYICKTYKTTQNRENSAQQRQPYAARSLHVGRVTGMWRMAILAHGLTHMCECVNICVCLCVLKSQYVMYSHIVFLVCWFSNNTVTS